MPYANDLLQRKQWRQFSQEMLEFLWVRRFPWRGIRYRLSQLVKHHKMAEFPEWVAPDFSLRLGLRDRWKQDFSEGLEKHSLLPEAYASLTSPYWKLFFELEDPGITRASQEVRYPLLDLRVVNYLLSLPSFPWLFEKRIFRDATRNRLPERIRRRPKTPLSDSQLDALLGGGASSWPQREGFGAQIASYVDLTKVPQIPLRTGPENMKVIIRAFCLNFWLRSALRVGYKLNWEGYRMENPTTKPRKKAYSLLH